MDYKLRQLEREAATGSPEAEARLVRYRARIGEKECPTVLYMAKRRMSKAKDILLFYRTTSNRNRQRLRRHKAGRCGPKCRFCRKYGPYKDK